MSLYNKYGRYYILPEPTIAYVYCSKPIVKSIQTNKKDTANYLDSLSTDDICEIVYTRTKTLLGSEWKQIIQKN